MVGCNVRKMARVSSRQCISVHHHAAHIVTGIRGKMEGEVRTARNCRRDIGRNGAAASCKGCEGIFLQNERGGQCVGGCHILKNIGCQRSLFNAVNKDIINTITFIWNNTDIQGRAANRTRILRRIHRSSLTRLKCHRVADSGEVRPDILVPGIVCARHRIGRDRTNVFAVHHHGVNLMTCSRCNDERKIRTTDKRRDTIGGDRTTLICHRIHFMCIT